MSDQMLTGLPREFLVFDISNRLRPEYKHWDWGQLLRKLCPMIKLAGLPKHVQKRSTKVELNGSLFW